VGNSTPDVIYADVMNRDHAPDVDLMISGVPCPPFSAAGKGKAMADARGWLLLSSVKYDVMRKPPVFGLENVRGLANVKNKWILKRIQQILKLAGYKCYCAVMDTMQGAWHSTKPSESLLDCVAEEALAA
jgi:DNA (cytosine-5)-methyltransferase 1